MEENLHNDNLDSFFRKEFENLPDAPAPDGWDIPSDDLWGRIEAATPVGRGIFSFSRTKLLLGILLLGMLGSTLFLWFQNRALNEDIRLQAQEIELLNQASQKDNITPETIGAISDKTEESPEDHTDIPQESSFTKQISPSSAAPLKKEDLSAFPVTEKTNKRINKMAKTPDQTIFSASAQNGKNDMAGIDLPESGKNDENIQKTEKFRSSGLNDQVMVSRLALPIPFIYVPERPIKLFPGGIQETALPVIPVKKLSFYAGGYIAPNLTSGITKSSGGPLWFRSFEKEQWSNEAGIKFGILIGDHWKISTGLGLFKAGLISRQIFRIEYDHSIETQVGDEYQSTYALSVPSSYGSADLEVDFRRSSSDQLSQGQNILLDVITRQKLKFVNIPLLVGYEWGTKRLKYGVQTGLALNILNTTVLEAEISSKNMRFRRYNQPRVTRQFTETRKTGFDLVLSANLAYDLSPSVRFSVEPVFRKSVTPVVSTEDFSNKLYGVGLQLGAYYRF
ncbi:MAG: hypothetical protein KDC85_14200 [Saprospiraceae bacterium]|nr:hypothetical protein [Saprospiraceae bacterium]MCB9324249.1 hypothetical protein [Lewinellaceae bacterium]